MPAAPTVAARLASAAAVVLGVSVVVFLLIHLVPGDPVDVMLGEYATSADRAALRARLGLDRPLHRQWLDFLAGAARLDLGTSLYDGRAVLPLVAERFAMTVGLALVALPLALALGVPLGMLAALRRGRSADTASGALAVVAMSVPNFVLGPVLLIVFAVTLRWFPIGGAQGWTAVVLPAFTLGASLAAVLARMTRAALLDVLDEPFIVAARARGLTETRVVLGHVLRNAALPLVTTVGLQLGALLGGAVVTEVVFAWPGVGQLAVESIHRRDYPVLQACVLVISISYVVLNTLTDVLYLRLDPRIREGQ